MTSPFILGSLMLGLTVALPVLAQSEEKAEPTAAAAPETKLSDADVKSHASYALGYRAGARFAEEFGQYGLTAADLESEVFFRAFLNAFAGQEPTVEAEKIQAAMQGFGNLLMDREKKLAETNLAEGKKFLEENGKREGVITTDSGLQYEIIAKGGEEKYAAPAEGAEGPQKQFQVNYKGSLINGTQFDASPEGQPVTMSLEVVPGFREALTTMPVGAKWKLFIPSNLAYGEERRSSHIGPNSVLVFELELVKIEDAPQAPQGGYPFPMPGGE